MCSVNVLMCFHLKDGRWLLLLVALRDIGPGGQCSGYFSAPSLKPILVKEVDATLDQYLATGLIQHSTSPYSSPLVVIPKTPGRVRITANYKKLNQISKLSQLPIPHVDQVLDSLGAGRGFSLLDLVSSFNQTKAQKDTAPLTAVCTSTALYEWLVVPQGSSASPGWFVNVINEVMKGFKRVVAYLDDVIVFDSDPIAHVQTIRYLFECCESIT